MNKIIFIVGLFFVLKAGAQPPLPLFTPKSRPAFNFTSPKKICLSRPMAKSIVSLVLTGQEPHCFNSFIFDAPTDPPFPAEHTYVMQWDNLQYNWYYYFQGTVSLSSPHWINIYEGLWSYAGTNAYFGLEVPITAGNNFFRVSGKSTTGQPLQVQGIQPPLAYVPLRTLRPQQKGQPYTRLSP